MISPASCCWPSRSPPMRGLTPAPVPAAAPADPDADAALFQQAVGQLPENLASAYSRVFLGVRLNCAQCHDHPFTDWKQKDFWGMAAFFNSARPDGRRSPAGRARQRRPRLRRPISPCRCRRSRPGAATRRTRSIRRSCSGTEGTLKEIAQGPDAAQVLADWMVGPQNPNFAATAVNRVWQYLCGRGLAGSVDDLDRVSQARAGDSRRAGEAVRRLGLRRPLADHRHLQEQRLSAVGWRPNPMPTQQLGRSGRSRRCCRSRCSTRWSRP